MFGNTPLTAVHVELALGSPFPQVWSHWACSCIFCISSSTWPVVLMEVQHIF